MTRACNPILPISNECNQKRATEWRHPIVNQSIRGSNGISCREGITFSCLHRIRCLPQERGPRYVNNVAVFVKKGQKDIDANERPCHAEMSSMDALKTVWLTSPNGQALVNAFIMTQNMTQNMSSGCTGCTGLKKAPKTDITKTLLKCCMMLHGQGRSSGEERRAVSQFVGSFSQIPQMARFHMFSHCSCSSSIKFQHQVPLRKRRKPRKPRKRKTSKRRPSLVLAKTWFTHHTSLVQRCAESHWSSLILIDSHWFSLILIDSRDSEMQRTAFAILVQSVPGQLTRSSDVPCQGVAPCADPISFTRTPLVHGEFTHPAQLWADFAQRSSPGYCTRCLVKMSLWRGERFLMSFDAS